MLVLDQITDPHNVGAILRTAAGFAVSAVVTTARHSPEATGVLAKSASGALEYVPIVTVQNLARALEALKERGYLAIGLDSSGDSDLADVPLRAPLALVLGAEGKGLRQLTRTTCDAVARLDLPGRIKSLNVSNAAALALYVDEPAARSAQAAGSAVLAATWAAMRLSGERATPAAPGAPERRGLDAQRRAHVAAGTNHRDRSSSAAGRWAAPRSRHTDNRSARPDRPRSSCAG